MPIKLTKAIELNEFLLVDRTPDLFKDEQDAIRLGIVGLKAIQFCRHGGAWHPEALLPGEQPEEIVK